MIKQRPIYFVISLIIFYLIIQSYILYKFYQPYSGIIASKEKHNTYTISQIDTSGWAAKTALKAGDEIYKVDGANPYLGVFKRYQNQFLNATEIQTIQNDRISTYSTTATSDNEELIITLYLPMIFSLTILSLCFIVYRNKAIRREERYFMLFLLATSISLSASSISSKSDFGGLLIISISFQSVSLFLTLFLYQLFKRKEIIIIHKNVIRFHIFLYMTVITTGLLSVTFLPNLQQVSAYTDLAYLCFSILLSVYFLLKGYIKYRNTLHRPFFKFMLVIQCISFGPFIMLYALPRILFNAAIIRADIAALFLFCIPIGYFYLILTKQIFDIDFMFDRVRYYSLLSLLPTIIITLIISWGINPDERFFIRLMQNFIIIFPLNILFLVIKERLDFTFRNQLFRSKTNLHVSIDQFAQQLSSIMKVKDLEKKFMNEIISLLKPCFIQFIEFDTKQNTYNCYKSYGETEKFNLSKKKQWGMESGYINDLLEDDGCIGIYLYSTQNTKHYIWVGNKTNNIKFNINEKTWFIAIVKYVRLVYENLNSVNQIIQSLEKERIANKTHSATLSRLLFQISETERRRLAADLHDAALQDQIVWYRKLETVLKEHTVPGELQGQLEKIKFGMFDVIQQIRDTCNELKPALLSEIGLIGALKELLAQMQLRTNFRIQFEYDSIQENHYEFDKILSIYRIIQELLNNADKHSNATLINIFLWEENNCIYLDYRDNGIGFNTQAPYSSNKHMGLSGIKGRVQGIGGEIQLISEIGNGLQVNITIPR
ncbi:competence protein comp [Bacillus thuringiensis]|uniref:sensor histidine kinase n=1 Tax=Bacillus thuringiensis TaxID=1428 RepID=UPI000BF5D6E0|nr:sensor histidine kinase [Bacillus thuringiensis]PEZ39099.1 competence protein comp [Bacillus thuringiensis]PGY40148.1 competence protein comp [Bacillus thuringiensis]